MKSLLSYFIKIRDGVLFAETFENDNFAYAQGWVVLQGVASNTAQQARDGIKSLKLAGLATPILWKAITDNAVDKQVVEVWFYDTLDTVLPGPFFKIKTQAGKYLQVGVRNGTSTGYYVTNAANVFTEDTFGYTTAVARTLGWHRFRFKFSGSTVTVQVDTTDVQTHAVVVGSYITDLKLQADVLGSSSESFGYFDEVRVFRHDAVMVSGILGGRIINFRDATESSNPQTLAGGGEVLAEYNPDLYTMALYPVSYSFQLTQKDKPTLLASRMPYRDVNLGDWYRYEEIDFGGRRVTTFDLTPRTLTTRNESANGHTEAITYGWKDRLQFTVNALEGRAYWLQAQNWYEYARTGEPFSLLVEEDDCAYHRVRTFARAGADSLELFLNYTGGGGNVSEGQTLVLQKADRSARQVVTVLAVTANALGPIIQLDQRLHFDVEVYDVVRSLYFFQALEMEGQDLGLNMSNARRERFNWQQTVREYAT